MLWQPSAEWKRIETVDVHTAGEPLRLILSGFPIPPGDTVLERRDYARKNLDHYRRLLMWEPRGHADMYGCLLMPPASADGDVAVLFMHNEGYSTMCGHGIIGLVKAGVELGLFEYGGRTREIRIDTPAGRVVASAEVFEDRVEAVSFRNVPSFVLKPEVEVFLPDSGIVKCDIAYGGAFYAYVDANAVGLSLEPGNARRLIEKGMQIKQAVTEQQEIRHPSGDADLNFLYGTIFVESRAKGVHSRNVCIFAEGEVDRSPTGTGVSGRAAIHHARGELQIGDKIEIESLIGTRFGVRIVEETEVAGLPAVVPEVSGSAFVTGRHEFLLDPRDGLGEGFFVR